MASQIIHDPRAMLDFPADAPHPAPSIPPPAPVLETGVEVVEAGKGVESAALDHVWVRQRQDETLFLIPQTDAAVAGSGVFKGDGGMFLIHWEEDEGGESGDDHGGWAVGALGEEEVIGGSVLSYLNIVLVRTRRCGESAWREIWGISSI